jgi:anti-sigma factor RsiW
MSSCERFKENILDFIDNELNSTRKKELRHHVETCQDCDCLMEQMRILRTELKSLPRIKASENFNVILRECIRREAAGKRSIFSSPFVGQRWMAPAAGFAVVMIAIGIWTIIPRREGSPVTTAPVTNVQSTVPSVNRFRGQIQYVIEDYPERVSVSRSDVANDEQRLARDTLRYREPVNDLTSRMKTVSF